ncbi:hypothetical protein EBO15_38990 [Actinomadura harenae]|uniref:Uncharacterized protein n=1 Tax=Actinomadura harenae TaxID=2483351 RepID=A0A3M2LGW6_9ACTN|nr:hypothetical protein EBO15_38990 [Actinomadura harenae]
MKRLLVPFSGSENSSWFSGVPADLTQALSLVASAGPLGEHNFTQDGLAVSAPDAAAGFL